MAYLVRSLVVSAVLFVAFVAVLYSSDESGLKRRLAEDFLSFTDIDVASGEAIHDVDFIPDDTEFIEDPIPEEGAEVAPEETVVETADTTGVVMEVLASPDDFNMDAHEQHEEYEELQLLAHEYETALMEAAIMGEMAVHEEQVAMDEALEEETPEAMEAAIEAEINAEEILAEVQATEESIIQEEAVVQEEIEVVAAAIDDLEEFAEERRRHLIETMKARGRRQLTRNGVTYYAEEE